VIDMESVFPNASRRQFGVPQGRVSVTWQLEAHEHLIHLCFCSQKAGDPSVGLPENGFGSRLIGQSLIQETESTVLLAYPGSGVFLTRDAPLAGLQKA